MIEINIAREYSKTPGGRYIKEGKYSGEDFRERFLKPRYLEAQESDDILIVNLDGGYGYGSSFLEEAFGGLIRSLKNVDLERIRIVSEEEPQLSEDIKKYMSDALKNEGENKCEK